MNYEMLLLIQLNESIYLDWLMIIDYCFLDWIAHPIKDIGFLFGCKIFSF